MPSMGVWQNTLELLRIGSSYAGGSELVGTGRAGRAQPISWAQSGQLAQVVWSDVFGGKAWTTPVTQAEAMRVPGVARSRAILHSLLVPRRLVSVDATNQPVAEQPTWLYRSDTGISPQLRMSLILDDCIFREAALLAVERGAKPDGAKYAPILDAVHVPYERWDVDPDDGTLLVDDAPVDSDQVVWIPGPGFGLLRDAADTIRAARDMTKAWAQRVRTPVPSMLLEETEANGMQDDEVTEMLEDMQEARRSPDGSAMFVPYGIKATPLNPTDDSALFENGRNALRIDIANYFNLPAGLIDGAPNASTLTYDTRVGQRNALQDYTLPYWQTPIEAALSQDNVVPRGQRIRFDFSDLDAAVNAPYGPNTED